MHLCPADFLYGILPAANTPRRNRKIRIMNPSKSRSMSPPKSLRRPHVPGRLRDIISREFESNALAPALFEEFLASEDYSRSFASKLVGVAKGSDNAPWRVRGLAALMLENQILKLSPDSTGEFELLFVQLGLKSSEGEGREVSDSVLKEGYSTTQLRPFISEFRRRLERLNRLHERLAGARTTRAALEDFIALSKCDCKISIARYLFRPEEVVGQIVRQL